MPGRLIRNVSARLVAVSVGRPREVEWQGERVRTSIFKEPVAGRVQVRRLNIEGDEQSDLEVHGGEEKAVYAYPAEHYAYWREQLPGVALPWGAFGENLSVEGLLESGVHIGDRFRMGSAKFVVTEPRMPCYKLALRFGRSDMVKRFLRSGRTGFYLAVLEEGEIGAGDGIESLGQGQDRISVAAVVAGKSRQKLGLV
jgi:MOSC domain-containing protein YiiM